MFISVVLALFLFYPSEISPAHVTICTKVLFMNTRRPLFEVGFKKSHRGADSPSQPGYGKWIPRETRNVCEEGAIRAHLTRSFAQHNIIKEKYVCRLTGQVGLGTARPKRPPPPPARPPGTDGVCECEYGIINSSPTQRDQVVSGRRAAGASPRPSHVHHRHLRLRFHSAEEQGGNATTRRRCDRRPPTAIVTMPSVSKMD